MSDGIKVWSYSCKADTEQSDGLPHRKKNGKGKQKGTEVEKPLPPNGLWVSRFDDPPDVDCGDALNE